MPEATLQEIAAARELLNQQEAAIRQRAREEQERKEEERRQLALREKQTRMQLVKQAIVDEIHVLRPSLNVQWGGVGIQFFGGDDRQHPDAGTVWVDINQRYSGGTKWRHGSEIAGSYDVIIGSYGDKHRFPPKKDNTHNYDKIALEIVARYDRSIGQRRAAAQQAANKRANQGDVAAIRSEFNLREYYGAVLVSESTSEAGKVVLKISKEVTVTPERAREILIKLQELGLVTR